MNTTPQTLLVSPLGMSKGLLYSALKQIPCDSCLVIASKESATKLSEIQKKANYQGRFHINTLEDVFADFSVAKKMGNKCEDLLRSFESIICNVTGGTTAQQFSIQAIYEKAQEIGKDVHRVALIDRRGAKEQQKTPYVVGELINLDKD